MKFWRTKHSPLVEYLLQVAEKYIGKDNYAPIYVVENDYGDAMIRLDIYDGLTIILEFSTTHVRKPMMYSIWYHDMVLLYEVKDSNISEMEAAIKTVGAKDLILPRLDATDYQENELFLQDLIQEKLNSTL